MTDFQLHQGGMRVETTDLSGEQYEQCTASATANTKGSWNEIKASTGFEAEAFILCIGEVNGDVQGLVDLGMGGAGSEEVIIGDVDLWGKQNSAPGIFAYFPIKIPQGVRLATRCQAETGSRAIAVGLELIGPSLMQTAGFSRSTTYGAVTASNSRGTSITSNTNPNVKGTWNQITASTTEAHYGIYLGWDALGSFATSTVHCLVDIAVGAASSEQVIVSNIAISTGTSEGGNPHLHGPFWVTIPEASRLSVRMQDHVGNQSRGIVLYCLA